MPADPKPAARIRDPDLLRQFRLEHAGEPCDRCWQRPGVHAHHVVFRSRGGDDVAENLLWLCISCHHVMHGL